jgi:elongation factor P
MSVVSTADLKKGMYVIFKDEPCLITNMDFTNPGKGSAFYRIKLKSLKSGRVVENTFKSGETMEEYTVDTRELQFLYKDAEEAFFMNPQTYEQVGAKIDLIGEFAKFLQEGNTYQVLLHENDAIGLRPPKRVVFKIASTERTTGGNTVGRVLKPATLENGVEVQVPEFIKEGNKIAFNPDTGEYLERVND